MWYKRVKKKLAKYGKYDVFEKVDGFELMFAEPFKASCAEHALRRALKKWQRKYRRFHDFDRVTFRGCTKIFGNFCVYDINKRFHYYFE